MTARAADAMPADEVVDEIREAGGTAIVERRRCRDVGRRTGRSSTPPSRRSVISTSLVNNAGILRDSTIVNMTEDDFDEVVRVHLKGHFAPTKWAAAYWREQHKAGSTAPSQRGPHELDVGDLRQPGSGQLRTGQVGHRHVQPDRRQGARPLRRRVELRGARRTHPTDAVVARVCPEIMQAPAEGFDQWDPANVSPLVAYLAGASCRFNGETFYVQGGTVRRLEPWTLVGDSIEQSTRWKIDDLDQAMQAFESTAAAPTRDRDVRRVRPRT